MPSRNDRHSMATLARCSTDSVPVRTLIDKALATSVDTQALVARPSTARSRVQALTAAEAVSGVNSATTADASR